MKAKQITEAISSVASAIPSGTQVPAPMLAIFASICDALDRKGSTEMRDISQQVRSLLNIDTKTPQPTQPTQPKEEKGTNA
jgi:hypothetical protein